MDGHAVARKFEKHLMTERIKKLDNIDDVKKVAIGLVELNYGIRLQVSEMARMGWTPIYKPETE